VQYCIYKGITCQGTPVECSDYTINQCVGTTLLTTTTCQSNTPTFARVLANTFGRGDCTEDEYSQIAIIPIGECSMWKPLNFMQGVKQIIVFTQNGHVTTCINNCTHYGPQCYDTPWNVCETFGSLSFTVSPINC
jgi:hypothetical protein